MIRMLHVSIAALVLAGTALASSPFADVSPCHWATESIAEIAGQPDVDAAAARQSTYLAENAVRQVFEGLVCDDLAWSASFLVDVPPDVGPNAELEGFVLRDVRTSLAGARGTVAFTVDAVVDGQSVTRSGVAELVFADGGWSVRYPSLAALGLPLFP